MTGKTAAAVTVVTNARERDELLALLAAYEAILPEPLRHGELPSAGQLEALLHENTTAMLARLDGEAVGCVMLRDLDGESAVMQRLFVDARARNRGIARALVRALVEYARTAGYRRLVLDTDKSRLPAAYQLYVSLGFTPCAPYAPVAYEPAAFLELSLEYTSRRGDPSSTA